MITSKLYSAIFVAFSKIYSKFSPICEYENLDFLNLGQLVR